ncbi:hypothetical protein MNBD_BACTEROID07-2012 [hydrothermal vent metagenome]|uniref:Uncharacterized protein n=1 Tax=hydrothermal vent metagenome TaxID=652676 RepID=A0A3B0UCU7_9ZZZZ
MDKREKYRLMLDFKAVNRAEKYIERLFQEWSIDEIYLGNIIISISNIIHLLPEHPANRSVCITASLKNETISFSFAKVDVSVLKLFLKDYLLQDVRDNVTQSVFLIQKVVDEVTIEGENLILRFNTDVVPEAFFANRKQSLEDYYQNTPQKVIHD